MLASRDMAKSVRQEAYERACLPEPQAHVINHLLLILILQFVIDHVHLLQRLISVTRFCVSERFTVGELSDLPKSSSKPLCKVVVVVVWFILER